MKLKTKLPILVKVKLVIAGWRIGLKYSELYGIFIAMERMIELGKNK